MDIDDLLAADALGIIERTPQDIPRVPITWVATTELDDVARFLRGGELVLTTLLSERDDAALVAFVEGVAGAGAAALCVGIGHVRTHMPEAAVSAATRVGLPLLESPPEVPFVQISRFVADHVFADEYRAVRQHARDQETLLAAVSDTDPVAALVESLHRVLGEPVVLRDATGRLVAGRPRTTDALPDPVATPVRVRRRVVARIETATGGRPALRALAASVLGLELARRSATLEGRGELLGQVLDDVRHRRGDDPALARRLAAAGVDPREGWVVCARSERAGVLPAVLDEMLSDPATTLPVLTMDEALWVFAPSDEVAGAYAETLRARLAAHRATPGIGLARVVPEGDSLDALRAALVQARSLAGLGPGVHTEHPHPLAALVRHSTPAALLADRLLAPLRRHDAAHGSSLMETLGSFLATGGSVPETCARLVIHRNTLRYRLLSVRAVTGLDPFDFADRVELWLAVVAAGEVPEDLTRSPRAPGTQART